MSDIDIPKELKELANEVGHFMEYWGFKKIHGQIWAHLYLSERPLDAKDLMNRLDVSKGLISISIKDLLEYDVIQELGKSAEGTKIYGATPNVVKVITSVLRNRELKLLGHSKLALEGLKTLPKHSREKAEISEERLKLLSKMIATSETSLKAIITLGNLDLSIWTKIPFK